MTEVCLFLIASGLDLGAEREIMKTKSDSSILDEPRRGLLMRRPSAAGHCGSGLISGLSDRKSLALSRAETRSCF